MYEFEKLIGRVEWVRRYTTGPFLEERNAFLLHLRDLGYSARQLKTNNRYMLWIAELIDIRQSSAVTPAHVERAAKKWVATHCRARSSANTVRIAKGAFKQVAKNWLRFLDRWCSDRPCSRYLPQIDSFLQHLREDRGYTMATVLTRQSALRLFFNWLALKECALEDVVPTTIADHFVEHRSKTWKRITIAGYANSLRSFFSYASAQGWCKQGIKKDDRATAPSFTEWHSPGANLEGCSTAHHQRQQRSAQPHPRSCNHASPRRVRTAYWRGRRSNTR